MENTNEYHNNHLRIIGVATQNPTYTHTVKTGKGETRYYEFYLKSARLSGTDDTVLVSIKDEIMTGIDFSAPIEIIGEVRTANISVPDEEHQKLKIYAFAKACRNCEEESVNEFEATVYLCKNPTSRSTPMGSTLADLTLACVRSYKNRSDYFPSIAWRDDALKASKLNIGDKLYIKGRFQSREYVKKVDKAHIKKTAYEISIKSFEVLER